MLKIVFNNDLKNPVIVNFRKTNDNIVVLDYVVENTSGFKAYRLKDDLFLGDYSEFTTVYRVTENEISYSNDGSIYVEPEIVEPEIIEPTLDMVKGTKVNEMNATQQEVIQQGINVTLTDGTIEHFTLTDHDQTSLTGLQTQVMEGVEQIPWHTSDTTEHCKYYSNADMKLITQAALNYVAYHVTYFRDLRIYIMSLLTKEDVEEIYYGISIPEEYQSEPLKDMLSQM